MVLRPCDSGEIMRPPVTLDRLPERVPLLFAPFALNGWGVVLRGAVSGFAPSTATGAASSIGRVPGAGAYHHENPFR